MLFDGDVTAVRVEPTWPCRACASGSRAIRRRWVTGRAAQLGCTGARVVRDGVPAARAARRSTMYRNVEGWLLVR